MGALDAIDHIVVVMLENRSFDNLLGFLYPDRKTPLGHDFDGLTGSESNNTPAGAKVPVFKIAPQDPNAYWYPLVDPQEGFLATNEQLFGTETPAPGAAANCSGFVTSFAKSIAHPLDPPLNGASSSSIMGVYSPDMVPVLSGLATGFAVCDRWFSSVPTETFPNRAFALAATSLGRVMDERNPVFATPSIFGSLTAKAVPWRIYGYVLKPLTIGDFPDTLNAPPANWGLFSDFEHDAAHGLPGFCFLEPAWSKSGKTMENDQHPVGNVALGEQFLLQIYQTLRASPAWNKTLLIVTYDEHGGHYDHVVPPSDATPPSTTPGEQGFDFTRFGVRVPAVLVSPLIAAGTVFRAPESGPPLDHTSILATVEKKFGLHPLTPRDSAAPDLEAVLTLDPANPRHDDPMAGIVAPVFEPSVPAAAAATRRASKFLLGHAVAASKLPIQGEDNAAAARTADGFTKQDSPDGEQTGQFIEDRLTKWTTQTAARHAAATPAPPVPPAR
ncbi:MAG: alkaline phosphatase family protein [Acidimicrobiales bacterium]